MKHRYLAVAAAFVLALSFSAAHAGQDTILTSAVRTATTTTSDIVKQTEDAVTFILNVTAVPGVQTLTPKIQGKDSLGNYYDIVVGTASATTGIVLLKVGPGIASVANVAIGDMLPDVYRVVITHSSTGNFTYTLTRNTASYK